MNDEDFVEAVFDAVMGLAAAVTNVRKSGLPAGLAFEGEMVEVATELEAAAHPELSMAVVEAALAVIREEYMAVTSDAVLPPVSRNGDGVE